MSWSGGGGYVQLTFASLLPPTQLFSIRQASKKLVSECLAFTNLGLPRRNEGGGIVRELGVDMYTLLYLKWITNKAQLQSTGNSAQCHGHHEWEGSLGENGYMFMYGRVPLLSTWNYHSLVNRFSVQFSSVTLLCPTLCDPMDCSTPGLPAHHQLLKITQTPVHPVGDAIQPSHPLSSPSPPAFNLSQHQDLFQWVS